MPRARPTDEDARLAPEDPRLTRVSALCLALPEAEREDANGHAGFTVRGRRFAWYLADHHGDGVVGLVVKLPPGEQDALLGVDPDRFYFPSYLGARGWIGLRLDRGPVDWGEVEGLVVESFRLVAPKRLAAKL